MHLYAKEKSQENNSAPTAEKKKHAPQSEQVPFFLSFGLAKEKEYLIENLSLMLTSGISIVAALRSIRNEVKSERLKKILIQAELDIEAGFSLGETLGKTRLLSDHTIALIKIGEESGRLAENLQLVSIQEEKDRMFRSKIRSAMMYPVLVMSVAGVVGIGIAWFILPKLAMVFKDLKLKLPFITRALIGFGNFLGEHGAIAIPAFILVISLIIYIVFIGRKTKKIGQTLLFHTPAIGPLIQQVELGRMGHVLGTLLDAGIPLVEALGSLAAGTTLTGYKKCYLFLQNEIDEGNTFQDAFKKFKKIKKSIPSPIQQMIVAGEQTGNLAMIYHKIGTMYESKTETTMKNVSVILEPLLLFVVWIGVVFVALAVILPIYSLIGGLN